MDPLKPHMLLRASSLLEAIVASVLFMTVFAVSLETLGRLTLSGDGGEVRMAMDNALQHCQREYLSQPHADASVTKTYPWGTVAVTLEPYGNTSGLQLLVLTAACEKTRQRVQWRRILYHPDNAPDDEMQ